MRQTLTALAMFAAALALLGVLAPAFVPLAPLSAAGIPRWVPLGLAVVLTCAAGATWCRRWPFPLLAAFWAVGGACFARPGLRALLGIDLRLEPVLLILALATGAAAVWWPGSRIDRKGLAWAAAVPALLASALALPSTPAVNATAYTLILVAWWPSWRAAHIDRRFRR